MKEFIRKLCEAFLSSPWYWIILIGCIIIIFILIKYGNKIRKFRELINNKINIHNIVDKDKRKVHIESINVNKKEYDNNTCPKCGGKLVERTSKYGKFYGCSNYPRCKYTKKC